MRKYLFIALALVLVLGMGSCKIQLDKLKIATLLTGYVLDYVAGNEIDLSDLDALAEGLAMQFAEAFADEYAGKHYDLVIAFAKDVIPDLIRKFGFTDKRVAGTPDMRGEAVDYVLDAFDEFYKDYK